MLDLLLVGRDGGSCADSGSSQHMWNYDKIAANDGMAEAFRAFANRALCQESVWFLEEVSRWVEGTLLAPVTDRHRVGALPFFFQYRLRCSIHGFEFVFPCLCLLRGAIVNRTKYCL